MIRSVFSIILLFITLPLVYAEKINKDLVTISIQPDHYDWNYKVGENVVFTVTLLKDQQPLNNVNIRYECGPEQQPAFISDSVFIENNKAIITCKGLSSPGFLTCRIRTQVEGYTYSELISVAYEPDHIKPTTTLPDDFKSFWEGQLKKISSLPIQHKMVWLPDESTEEVDVYHVRLTHIPQGTYIYGILCRPKKEGKYPAVLRLPGAGVTRHRGDKELARMGVITFQIGIHGIPLNLPDEIYTHLWRGALSDYMFYGLDNPETYYYNRVYLSCIRANDFLCSLPEYDGENLGVYGGSQGGALSIVTAALDSRVKYIAALYPALCDLTGYQYDRAGGWPHFDSPRNPYKLNAEQANNSRYYDIVNFARYITIPGFYSWGYCDVTCPPTSYYSAYNLIPGEKTLYLIKETGHWRYPEQNKNVNKWFYNKFYSDKTTSK